MDDGWNRLAYASAQSRQPHIHRSSRALGRLVNVFDAETMLADLNSPEATLIDGSVVVTAAAADILGDLCGAFVRLN